MFIEQQMNRRQQEQAKKGKKNRRVKAKVYTVDKIIGVKRVPAGDTFLYLTTFEG